MNGRFGQRGVTLVELIMGIVVISIAVASVLGALSTLSVRSADAMIRDQAAAIASSYLEEVSLKSFVDPDGGGVEAQRALYDDVDDYNGLSDVGAHDQFGNAIAGLDQYNVRVTVAQDTLTGMPAADVRRIDVTVSNASGVLAVMSGYRTKY